MYHLKGVTEKTKGCEDYDKEEGQCLVDMVIWEGPWEVRFDWDPHSGTSYVNTPGRGTITEMFCVV